MNLVQNSKSQHGSDSNLESNFSSIFDPKVVPFSMTRLNDRRLFPINEIIKRTHAHAHTLQSIQTLHKQNINLMHDLLRNFFIIQKITNKNANHNRMNDSYQLTNSSVLSVLFAISF